MLPSYVSQIVTIVKDTSLGFVVAAEEFLSRARVVGNFRGGRYLVPALMVAALAYLVVNLTLSRLAQRLGRRAGRKSGGVVAIDPELQLAGPEPLSDRALAAEARAQATGADRP
jgi:glutamate transport system permease protein